MKAVEWVMVSLLKVEWGGMDYKIPGRNTIGNRSICMLGCNIKFIFLKCGSWSKCCNLPILGRLLVKAWVIRLICHHKYSFTALIYNSPIWETKAGNFSTPLVSKLWNSNSI